jgi:hypothetical protein
MELLDFPVRRSFVAFMMSAAFVALGAIGCVACGGAEQPAMRPLPPRVTRATLAGPLCEDQEVACTCRGPDAATDAGAPGAGLKRYELRLAAVDSELWATLDDMVFYKSPERAEECFYVDLQPGKHPVSLRAEAPKGFAARLTIAEQGAQGWYDTFTFHCGAPGHCSMADLDAWDAWLRGRKGKVHDPCGSTKVRELRWQTGRVPDRVYPDALALDLVLDIYRFTPAHGPGDPACAGR